MAGTPTQAPATDPAREPAPGRLDLIRQLLNTADVMEATEELVDLRALSRWLRARGLIASRDRLGEGDLERAVAVREALRDLIEQRTHGRVPAPAVLRTLNEAARGAQLRVEIARDGGARLAPAATGLDRALAELLAIVAEASADGTWDRLKVCAADDCRWGFYDSSRNHSATWCNMASCGNRAKARAYRARRRGGRAARGARAVG